MTTDRCPACSAAVTPGAPWCTLCYEPLAIAATPPSMAESWRLPVEQPVEQPQGQPVGLLAELPVQQPVAVAEQPAWPCRGCRAVVPLAEDVCPHCGTAFLEPEAALSVRLPGVGDVTRLEKPQRVMLIIGGMAAATALFVLVAFVVGAIL